MGNEHSQQSGYAGAPGGPGGYPPNVPPTLRKTDAGSLTTQFAQRYPGSIADSFSSLDQVQDALRRAGLESSNLIVGIDFTKSNEWTGKHSFGGRNLHALHPSMPNPYEQAMAIIGNTLAPFDEDNLIPCYGFGDVTSHDQDVFNFYDNGRPCNGFPDALLRYRQVVSHTKLAGPTSFAPIVEAAVRTVEESGGQYHVLLIVADGQVTRSSDLRPGEFSPQERATIDAIVAASNYALSIVMVGVGDGPWHLMKEFDDNLPARNFDNFQFVNFGEIMASRLPDSQKEARFALAALMEIPQQFALCQKLRLIGKRVGRMPPRKPLRPPPTLLQADASGHPNPGPVGGFAPPTNNFRGGGMGYPPPGGPGQGGVGNFAPTPGQGGHGGPSAPPQWGGAAGSGGGGPDAGICPICLTNAKNLAFQCGHQTCQDCGAQLTLCPICRKPIKSRLRLYG